MTFSDTKRLLGGVATQIGEKNLSLIAAGVAFFGMLALFPAMAAIIAIWGLMSDPHVLIEQLDLIRNLLPDEVVRLIENQINALSTTSGDRLGWAGLISTALAIWSARSGVAALILGLNAIHGRKNRNSLRHYLTALGLTVALLGVSFVTLSAVVIVPIIFAIVPLGPITALMVEAFRWCAAIFVLMAGLAVIYRYGPNNRGERLRWITPGAVLAVALWAVASYGFSLYLTNFGNYNEVYGSIGAAVAMLMWLFISAFLILLGAVVNLQLTAIAPPAADAKGS
ncbi:YihY/virulence factor BrkB family protein [Pseudooceanicola nitratireducens]|uniref:YihY/virulence factor BrkB family protein n=1 Tax=Pseudooceanicola nitratireducens TaxID=517719 RepID=UPI001C94875C|nr:YihY/virulence factor BrkB family protein [Pseudooceanicola nitratireducens]MBY6164590.1 YihY/virulence factor BrkB family protein [Pseudooceanicola nitratireducens]